MGIGALLPYTLFTQSKLIPSLLVIPLSWALSQMVMNEPIEKSNLVRHVPMCINGAGVKRVGSVSWCASH